MRKVIVIGAHVDEPGRIVLRGAEAERFRHRPSPEAMERMARLERASMAGLRTNWPFPNEERAASRRKRP
jgi:hypothetical protein